MIRNQMLNAGSTFGVRCRQGLAALLLAATAAACGCGGKEAPPPPGVQGDTKVPQIEMPSDQATPPVEKK
jgi:hypothetical protein